MTERDDQEFRLALALAPMLFTIATFSLAAAATFTQKEKTIADELLSLLAGFSIFAAALLADSALDKLKIPFNERLTFLGGGYISFCVVMSFMTAFVPILYEARQSTGEFIFDRSFIYFIAAGLCVFGKMMTHQDKKFFTYAMVFFFLLSIHDLWH